MRTLTVCVLLGMAMLPGQHVQDEDKTKRNPAIGNISSIAAGRSHSTKAAPCATGKTGRAGGARTSRTGG